jgi:hypothetical protein
MGVDQASTVLKDAYAEEEEYLLRPDPQTPPLEYMERSVAIEPDILLDSPLWEQIATIRESGTSADLPRQWAALRSLVP